MQNRPTPHEKCKKLVDALAVLRSGCFQLGPLKHLSGDLDELGLDSAKELPDLLIDLIEEINTIGPIACYAGSHPPQRSYEPEIAKLELWAYCWHSDRYGMKLYLKFALRNGCYIHVDCHVSRPPGD